MNSTASLVILKNFSCFVKMLNCPINDTERVAEFFGNGILSHPYLRISINDKSSLLLSDFDSSSFAGHFKLESLLPELSKLFDVKI